MRVAQLPHRKIHNDSASSATGQHIVSNWSAYRQHNATIDLWSALNTACHSRQNGDARQNVVRRHDVKWARRRNHRRSRPRISSAHKSTSVTHLVRKWYVPSQDASADPPSPCMVIKSDTFALKAA